MPLFNLDMVEKVKQKVVIYHISNYFLPSRLNVVVVYSRPALHLGGKPCEGPTVIDMLCDPPAVRTNSTTKFLVDIIQSSL